MASASPGFSYLAQECTLYLAFTTLCMMLSRVDDFLMRLFRLTDAMPVPIEYFWSRFMVDSISPLIVVRPSSDESCSVVLLSTNI